MLAFLIRRLFQSAAVVFAMSLIVFAGVHAIGDPVQTMIGPQATQEDIAKTRSALGLDRPVTAQYWRFITGALKGDLGRSYAYSTPAIDLIAARMPATLELALTALVIALVFGIPLGLWAGLAPDSFSGKAIMAGSILGFSLPTFWVGLLLIMVFSVELGWLPPGGRGQIGECFGTRLSICSLDGARHILMPALNLALFKLSLIVRLTRAATEEALQQEYVKFARAKGLKNSRIIGVHVLKNIMIPIVTVTGLEFGSLIAFSVVTESIFGWPGMGKLIIDSIGINDQPVVIAYLLVILTLFITINFIVDVLYSLLDPRIRLAGPSG